jgi:hypothetical protein
MTSLLDRPTPAAGSNNGTGGYRLPVVPRGRRPLLTLASALLVLASAAIFASIYTSADHRVPVLVVTSTIHQGQRITAADLGTADVASSGGLSPIPVSSASELSGTWAAVTIPAGSLLSRGDVTSSRPLATGSAVVGLALKDGQLPAAGVEPGDQVMIVQTLAAGSVLPAGGDSDDSGATGTSGGTGGADADGDGFGSVSSAGVLVGRATVFETAAPSASTSSGATELVSVEVPSTLAAAVATASAASQVSLVLLPDRPAGSGSAAAAGSGSTASGSGSGAGSP